jgi:hypothetical protein
MLQLTLFYSKQGKNNAEMEEPAYNINLELSRILSDLISQVKQAGGVETGLIGDFGQALLP